MRPKIERREERKKDEERKNKRAKLLEIGKFPHRSLTI